MSGQEFERVIAKAADNVFDASLRSATLMLPTRIAAKQRKDGAGAGGDCNKPYGYSKLAYRNLDGAGVSVAGSPLRQNGLTDFAFRNLAIVSHKAILRIASLLRRRRLAMAADFGLEAFKQGALGRRVGPVLTDIDNVRDMIALCRHDIPAVRAVGKQLLALGLKPKDETEKKHIGRWVRQVMGTAGWEPIRSGKLPRGNLFSTGAIYKPRAKS